MLLENYHHQCNLTIGLPCDERRIYNKTSVYVYFKIRHFISRVLLYSGGSRISCLGGHCPVGGGGGANLRHVHFLAKMYAKMKEIDPVGGGGAPAAPPGSANGIY